MNTFLGPLIMISLTVGSFSRHFQRTEAEGFVENLLDEPVAFVAVEEVSSRVAEVLDDEPNFTAEDFAFEIADARQVELVDQLRDGFAA